MTSKIPLLEQAILNNNILIIKVNPDTLFDNPPQVGVIRLYSASQEPSEDDKLIYIEMHKIGSSLESEAKIYINTKDPQEKDKREELCNYCNIELNEYSCTIEVDITNNYIKADNIGIYDIIKIGK